MPLPPTSASGRSMSSMTPTCLVDTALLQTKTFAPNITRSRFPPDAVAHQRMSLPTAFPLRPSKTRQSVHSSERCLYERSDSDEASSFDHSCSIWAHFPHRGLNLSNFPKVLREISTIRSRIQSRLCRDCFMCRGASDSFTIFCHQV